ncbi:MAG: hypothetical protein CSA66_01190 [Proteobacteria bacterium]|nr:MAG: hypothetical protein CSA66_01190 [Pseudomonadota bacterium]
MPILDPNDNLRTHKIAGSRYGFSGTRVDQLGASEWTLVAVAADVSGSVQPFVREIEGVIASTVQACRLSPRSDHLMLRVVAFDGALHEVHGFKPLAEARPDDYRGALSAGGLTALYDAAHNAVSATVQYGEALTARGMAVNAILFVITDGGDNASTEGPAAVAEAVRRAVRSEALESVLTVLVGVNVTDPAIGGYLTDLSTQAGFDHYLELGDADARTLAGLADFVSRSIAAQSIVLGTGGPSALLVP